MVRRPVRPPVKAWVTTTGVGLIYCKAGECKHLIAEEHLAAFGSSGLGSGLCRQLKPLHLERDSLRSTVACKVELLDHVRNNYRHYCNTDIKHRRYHKRSRAKPDDYNSSRSAAQSIPELTAGNSHCSRCCNP